MQRHCPRLLSYMSTSLVGALGFLTALWECVCVCLWSTLFLMFVSVCVFKWQRSGYSFVKEGTLFYFVPLWQKHTELFNNTYPLLPPFSFFSDREKNKWPNRDERVREWRDAVVALRGNCWHFRPAEGDFYDPFSDLKASFCPRLLHIHPFPLKYKPKEL